MTTQDYRSLCERLTARLIFAGVATRLAGVVERLAQTCGADNAVAAYAGRDVARFTGSTTAEGPDPRRTSDQRVSGPPPGV